jgi:hypothetical protein
VPCAALEVAKFLAVEFAQSDLVSPRKSRDLADLRALNAVCNVDLLDPLPGLVILE